MLSNNIKQSLILFIVAIIVTSCHNSCNRVWMLEPDIKIILRLNWNLYAEHAPFFVALHKGYYAKEHISLDILEGSGSANTTRLVAQEKNTFGYADTGTVISVYKLEYPIKIIGVFSQTSPMAICFKHNKPINKPQDLIGKRIGVTTGDATSKIFPSLLNLNNIPISKVKIINFATPQLKEKALISDDIDALVGYFVDQPPKLEKRYNIKINWIKYSEWGINTLSSAIIVNTHFLKTNSHVVKNFIKATQLGFKYTRDNPSEAAKIYSLYWQEYPVEKLEAFIKESVSLYYTPNSLGNRLGLPSSKDWEQTFFVLKKYLFVKNLMPLEEYFTAEFLEDIK